MVTGGPGVEPPGLGVRTRPIMGVQWGEAPWLGRLG